MTGRLGCILWIALAVAGCASVPRPAGFSQVQELARQRINHRLLWNQDAEADRQVAQAVAQRLQSPLSLDAATQIALLNNPDLQAAYETLAITQADVVEAGLLDNPTLWGSTRFPDRSPSKTNLEFDVTLNFLNLLMLPARKRLAHLQFERTKLQVADQVYRLTTQVEAAYYDGLAARQIQQVRQLTVQSARAGLEMARRMHSAGNLSDLELARRQREFEQARLALAQGEERLLETRATDPYNGAVGFAHELASSRPAAGPALLGTLAGQIGPWRWPIVGTCPRPDWKRMCWPKRWALPWIGAGWAKPKSGSAANGTPTASGSPVPIWPFSCRCLTSVKPTLRASRASCARASNTWPARPWPFAPKCAPCERAWS